MLVMYQAESLAQILVVTEMALTASGIFPVLPPELFATGRP